MEYDDELGGGGDDGRRGGAPGAGGGGRATDSLDALLSALGPLAAPPTGLATLNPDVAALRLAWLNEVHAPELLPHAGGAVRSCGRLLEAQSRIVVEEPARMSSASAGGGGDAADALDGTGAGIKLAAAVFNLDVERVRPCTTCEW